MKIGLLFKGTEAENYEDVERMQTQIDALGGMLHFEIRKDEDGWSAQCKEVAGIIAGGSTPNPDDYEIENQIRDAIYTAFHIKTRMAPSALKAEVTQVALSFA